MCTLAECGYKSNKSEKHLVCLPYSCWFPFFFILYFVMLLSLEEKEKKTNGKTFTLKCFQCIYYTWECNDKVSEIKKNTHTHRVTPVKKNKFRTTGEKKNGHQKRLKETSFQRIILILGRFSSGSFTSCC